MKHEHESTIGAIPEKPFRSKLDPHYGLIRDLRQKRYTYRDIARFLHEQVKLSVDHSTIYDFLQVRRRRERTGNDLPHEDRRACAAPPQVAPSAPVSAPAPGSSRRISEAYLAIERFKNRKRPEPPPQPRFHFEEGQTLTFIDTTTERED